MNNNQKMTVMSQIDEICNHRLTQRKTYITHYNTIYKTIVNELCDYDCETIHEHKRSRPEIIEKKLLFEKNITKNSYSWAFKHLTSGIEPFKKTEKTEKIRKNILFKSNNNVTYENNKKLYSCCDKQNVKLNTMALFMANCVIERVINKINYKTDESFWLSREVDIISKLYLSRNYFEKSFLAKLRSYYRYSEKSCIHYHSKLTLHSKITLALKLVEIFDDNYMKNHPFIFYRKQDNETDTCTVVIKDIKIEKHRLIIAYKL